MPERSAVSPPFPESPGVVRLDGYQIIERIGGGGMGTVWRAIQLSTRRQVALKVLNPELVGSKRAQLRFDREIDITSRLQHPNIARIYDSGIHHGAYFYAMELIVGQPLDEYVQLHKLSHRQVLELMRTVCSAVEYAHLRGVIHRDLKPSNILVTRDGQPHLLDFGLGKYCQTTNELDWSADVTLEGEWAGTPAYMSPEQAAGRGSDVDTRTDVYSLGVVLYQLLTGRFPYDTKGAHLEVLRRIIEQDIQRPSKVCPDLDPNLDPLFYKALAKSPDNRYPTAGLLAQDINNYLAGDPLIAKPLTTVSFICNRLRKHRWRVAVAASIALILAIAAIVATVRVRQERDRANEWARAERTQRKLADLRLADNLVLWGESLGRDGRIVEAQERWWNAHDLQLAHGVIPFAADMSLLQSFAFSPPPLVRFKTSPAASNAGNTIQAAWIGPDLRRLFQVDQDGRLRTYDLTAGRDLGAIGTPVAYVEGSAGIGRNTFTRLVSAQSDREDKQAGRMIEVVDSRNVSVNHRVQLEGLVVVQPFFSPSGRQMAYCSADGDGRVRLIVHNLADPDAVRTHDIAFPYNEYGNRLSFLSDDRLLCAKDQELDIFDLKKGTTVDRIDLTSTVRMISQIAVAPDGLSTLVNGKEGVLYHVDLQAKPTLRKLNSANGPVRHVTFSADARRCLGWDITGSIWMWDIESGELLQQFVADPGVEMIAGTSPDGQLVFACSARGDAWVWNATPKVPRVVSRDSDIISTLAVSPDGRMLAVGHYNCTLLLNDIETGRTLLRFQLKFPPKNIAFSPNGATLMAGDYEGRVYRFDLRKGELVQSFLQLHPYRVGRELSNGEEGVFGQTHFSGDLSVSLSSTHLGLTLWDTATGEHQILDPKPIAASTMSYDGLQVIYVAHFQDEMAIRGWRRDTGEHWSLPLDKTWAPTTVMCTSRDNKTVLVGAHDGTVRAFDVESRTWMWSVDVHNGYPVWDLSMTLDGRTALSCTTDGTIVVWDVATGRNVQKFKVGDGDMTVLTAKISPDGKRIISSTGDGMTACLWDFTRLNDFRTPQKNLQDAWARLRADPKDAEAAARCAAWYADLGRFDWAYHTLALADLGNSLEAQLLHARSLWVSGYNAEAVATFNALRERSPDLEWQQYMALCTYAAKREAQP